MPRARTGETRLDVLPCAVQGATPRRGRARQRRRDGGATGDGVEPHLVLDVLPCPGRRPGAHLVPR
ncbi:hypothetical protein [Sorangium sp. So ce362]|uniref:hypothetical protein n=1 Tax=Sorangium sp. So ce362 TaxID=3133303 RepID=UPI003F5D67E2